MPAMKVNEISENVIRRLPRYLRLLDSLIEEGTLRVSSAELGEKLGFTPSQVRQDFNTFGSFGQQGYGYSVLELRASIADILGTNRSYTAVMVGVGHIGIALLVNLIFDQYGICVTAAFDVDPAKIGKTVNDTPVYDMAEIDAYLEKNKVDIAVLTIPKPVARKEAKRLIDDGIGAFWNFTNVDLTDPGSPVISENVHFSDSLAALCYFVSSGKKSKSSGKN